MIPVFAYQDIRAAEEQVLGKSRMEYELMSWLPWSLVRLLLAVMLTIYIVQAMRGRGKPKPERKGNFNLGGLGYSGRPSGGVPLNSSPGAFALYGRENPNKPKDEEDPRRR